MTIKGTLALIMALTAATQVGGCKEFGQFVTNVGGNDIVGQQQANSGPYTAGSAVVEEIIVAEQAPAPEPDCTKEARRWRYNIYSECDTIIGTYGE
jgi:hypothetical protein